jgi:probable rRNA maturation factor
MVRVLVSRRIFRSLDPPFDHADVVRRVSRAARGLTGRGRKAQVSLLICSDPRIQYINREWLGRDRPTNVIAFPSPALSALTDRTGPLEPADGVLDAVAEPGPVPTHLGDIAVSVDTARREAGAAGGDARVVYLALHGLLHLLGWDHGHERAWRRMHRATLKLMQE